MNQLITGSTSKGNPQQIPYQEIFTALEKRLIEVGSENMAVEKIRAALDKHKTYVGRALSDDDYFRLLVMITFYSGFRAATVAQKKPIISKHFPGWREVASYRKADVKRILADKEMIRNKRKIQACIQNARTFSQLIQRHGSVRSFIDSYRPTDSFENLLLLKEALEAQFDYLGGITVYHFMTDIGLPVLKPDRVITRIFKRLGLLESSRQLLKAVLHGRKFQEATGKPARYVDIVLVAYGQAKSEGFGIRRGICLDKPRCDVCTLHSYCNYASTAARN